jgi:hypothetical protein
MTRKTLLGALCALAAACGGSGIDPAKVTFSYPSPAPVVAGTPEADGVAAGVVGVQGAQAVPGASDPTLAAAHAESIVNMPESVASACMDGSLAAAAMPEAQARFEKRAAGFARGDVRAAFADYDDPSCVTVAPGSITYRDCRETVTDPTDGSTVTLTVNGALIRTVVPGSATATWDVRLGVVGSDTVMTVTSQSHLTGTFTVTGSTLAGTSRNDTTIAMSMEGMSMRAAATLLGDYDLQFQADPFCVAGGTLEVRRVWTERPRGAGASELPDAGVKFTWGGCGIVTVAWGVRN